VRLAYVAQAARPDLGVPEPASFPWGWLLSGVLALAAYIAAAYGWRRWLAMPLGTQRRARMAVVALALSVLATMLLLRAIGVDLVFFANRLLHLGARWWLLGLVAVLAFRTGQASPPRSRVRRIPNDRTPAP
jgi:hypothetical protein